jgi:hypothetical protein
MTRHDVPRSLKNWFTLHCIVDLCFAIPLMIAPGPALNLLGMHPVDPVTARMTAAALFGIGLESQLCRNAGLEVFSAMLNLKIIWSLAALAGLTAGLATGAFPKPAAGLMLAVVFMLFNFVWLFWRHRLKKLKTEPS